MQKKNRSTICAHFDNYTYDDNLSPYVNDSRQFVYDLPEHLANNTDSFLRNDKKFDNIIKSYFRCNYKIVNIRLWRYLPKSNQNSKTEIGRHYDGFPHKCLKIMVYKGSFSNHHGALNLYKSLETDKIIYSVKGRNPIVILDTNNLLHGAKFPLIERDTIEITIMPSIKKNKPFFAGCVAGYQVNPFKKSRKKLFFFP